MIDTAKIEKMLIAICIPQKEMILIIYITILFVEKRNAIPAGIIHIPIDARMKDNLPNFSFFVRSPAAILPNIVATASVLSAAPY